jgi:hypothetical protein
MKYLKALAVVVAVLGTTACSNLAEYEKYSSMQIAVAESRASADKARINALLEIARTGDSNSKIAAVITLGQSQNASQAQPALQAPRSPADVALQWASILVPGLTQAYAIGKSADISINASNNAREVSASTNAAFVGMSGMIQGNSYSNFNNSTATPTVVQQAAPVVVQQPAPVIVQQPTSAGATTGQE